MKRHYNSWARTLGDRIPQAWVSVKQSSKTTASPANAHYTGLFQRALSNVHVPVMGELSQLAPVEICRSQAWLAEREKNFLIEVALNCT